MKINIKEVRKLIQERFDNKLTNFVTELGIDYSYMNLIMNGHRAPDSKKVCDRIVEYCKKNNLDYSKYVFF